MANLNTTINAAVPDITKQVPDRYQRYVPYILPILALIVGSMVILLLVIPTINDDLSIKDTSDSNGQKAAAMDLKIQQLKSIDQTQLTANLAKAEAALPSSKDVAGLLANINQDTGSSNTSVQSASLLTNPTTVTTNTKSIQFQVTVGGDFPSIKNFLTKLETTRRVIVVKTISLSSGTSSQLSALMLLETYYEPSPDVNPGSAVPLPPQSSTQSQILTDLDNRTNIIPAIPTPSAGSRTDPFASF